MRLGSYIRQLREKKDLSLREFARELEKSAAFISDVELGRRNPSKEVLLEIADFFAIAVKELEKHDDRIPVSDMKELLKNNPAQGAPIGAMLRKANANKLTKKDIDDLKKKLFE